MPTKVFNVLDATLFSQTITGSLTVSNGASPTIASLLSLVEIGSWDFLADFNGTMSGGFATVAFGGTAPVIQEIDIDYTKPITGLPADAKIKKMVINTPYTINVDMETDNIYTIDELNASGSIVTIVNGISNNIDANQIKSGNTVTPGQPPDGTDLLVSGIATVGSADADHVVFDLTGGGSHISLLDFVTDYSRITIKNNIMINGVINDIFGATNVDCIYSSSLGTGWTITVTYEVPVIEFELNPQVKNEDSPEDTVYYITDAVIDGVDVPLNTITDIFAYYGAEGPIEVTWILTNNPLNPLDPDGYWIYFILPVSIPVNEDVTIFVTGTEFSGSVEIQTIYAILVNGSGIYTLIPGQNYDIYYNRAVTPVETVNLTIPTPKFKTGYFGG